MKNDTKRWWGWIRETNSEQIRWAYAYLRKKNMDLRYFIVKNNFYFL